MTPTYDHAAWERICDKLLGIWDPKQRPTCGGHSIGEDAVVWCGPSILDTMHRIPCPEPTPALLWAVLEAAYKMESAFLLQIDYGLDNRRIELNHALIAAADALCREGKA